MFHDFCQSVTLVFCQRTHVSHDHHPRGPCCSRARISYDEPCMGAISYQKIFASALTDVRKTYPHADAAEGYTVFNIKGNAYRLIVTINYQTGRIFIRHVLTHEEYTRGRWKA